MKYASKYPFESLIMLVLLYYLGIIFLLEPIQFSYKLTYLLISIVFVMLTILIGYAFREKLDHYRQKMFSIFITGSFQKMNILQKIVSIISLSVAPFVVVSATEFLMTIIFTEAGAITLGFPLPVFSFSSKGLIYPNIFIDLVLFITIILFLGYAMIHSPDLDENLK